MAARRLWIQFVLCSGFIGLAGRTLRTFSGFVQDDIAFAKGSLHLIAGSKFESNEHSGVQIQPTIRLLFTPSTAAGVLGGSFARDAESQ